MGKACCPLECYIRSLLAVVTKKTKICEPPVQTSDIIWLFLFLFCASYGRNPFHVQFPFLPLLHFLKSYSSLLKTPLDRKYICTFSLLAKLISLGPVQWFRLLAASFSYRRLGFGPSKFPCWFGICDE
jgi:hypothetical protein